MALPRIGTLLAALTGESPAGLLSRYGLEAAAALCAVAGAGVLLTAAWVEMAEAWGPQPARLGVVAILGVGAFMAHAAAERRRRRNEDEAARARTELTNRLGLASALMRPQAARIAAPLVAFAAAFLLSRRR